MAVTGEKGSNEAPEEVLSKGAEEAIGFWHLGLNRTVDVGVEWDDIPGKVPIIARSHRVGVGYSLERSKEDIAEVDGEGADQVGDQAREHGQVVYLRMASP